MSAPDARNKLISLQMERLEAREAGVTLDSYLARLELSISETRFEYAVATMIEIAVLRMELSNPLPADGSAALGS